MKEVKFYKLGKLNDVTYKHTQEACEQFIQEERKKYSELFILNNNLIWMII